MGCLLVIRVLLIKKRIDDLVDDDDALSKKRRRLGNDQVAEEGKEEVTKEMMDFVMVLEGEIKKFNGFFMDKEEEYIITFKAFRLICHYYCFHLIDATRRDGLSIVEKGKKNRIFHGGLCTRLE